MTDREKIVWIAKAMESHEKTTDKSEYIAGTRFMFNDSGELEKIGKAYRNGHKIKSNSEDEKPLHIPKGISNSRRLT